MLTEAYLSRESPKLLVLAVGYNRVCVLHTRDLGSYPPPEVDMNVHRHMPPVDGTFGRLGLTDQEIEDIIAFMRTLTDGYVK